MKTFTKIIAALAVGSALFAGTAAASGWWNSDHDRYDRWYGGPWYGGYPGWGRWGYPGWGGWGYPGWGYPGYGWGRSRVQIITVPQQRPAPSQQPPVR